MQKELILLSVVLVTLQSQLVSAETCKNLRPANETFKPTCENNNFIKWPNYEDATTYYFCNGYKNPVLLKCDPGKYFSYVYQECVSCEIYVPAPPCKSLTMDPPPKCTPINGGSTPSPGETTTPTGPTGPTPSTLPTPKYPPVTGTTKTTTTQATTATTKTSTSDSSSTTTSSSGTATTKPSGSSTTGATGTTFPTPPTMNSSTKPPPNSTDIPPPPSPSTQNTLVPLPPTPEPTPPNVSVDPPYVSPKPSS